MPTRSPAVARNANVRSRPARHPGPAHERYHLPLRLRVLPKMRVFAHQATAVKVTQPQAPRSPLSIHTISWLPDSIGRAWQIWVKPGSNMELRHDQGDAADVAHRHMGPVRDLLWLVSAFITQKAFLDGDSIGCRPWTRSRPRGRATAPIASAISDMDPRLDQRSCHCAIMAGHTPTSRQIHQPGLVSRKSHDWLIPASASTATPSPARPIRAVRRVLSRSRARGLATRRKPAATQPAAALRPND